MSKEMKSGIMLIVFTLTISVAWYYAWVKPNTERMYSIMDCMSDINDHTEGGYNLCVSRLNEVG